MFSIAYCISKWTVDNVIQSWLCADISKKTQSNKFIILWMKKIFKRKLALILFNQSNSKPESSTHLFQSNNYNEFFQFSLRMHDESMKTNSSTRLIFTSATFKSILLDISLAFHIFCSSGGQRCAPLLAYVSSWKSAIFRKSKIGLKHLKLNEFVLFKICLHEYNSRFGL